MQLCDYLVSYLTKFAVEADKEDEGEGQGAVVAEAGGMKMLRRDLEDFTVGMAVKKRGKKKGGANLKKKDTLAHGVDTIDFFALLDIAPPSTISAVPAAIEALAAKKLSFQGLERGAVLSIADKTKAAKKANANGDATGKSKGKALGFSLDADFPTLGVKATLVVKEIETDVEKTELLSA